MKRAICAAMVLCVCLSFCACDGDITVLPSENPSSSAESSEIIVHERFSLPYNSSQNLNPFKTQSFLNIAISQTIAEGLTLTDPNGNVKLVLADSVVKGDDKLTYTVTLKNGVLFSDGTPLTSEDVVSSVLSVMNNVDCYYYGRLKNVASVVSVNSNSVVFTLKECDRDFEKMLSFPIVKDGSGNEDFVGTGPYKTESDAEEGFIYLSQNDNWHGGETRTKRVDLVGTTNPAELHYLLQTNVIDYYYSRDPSRTSGSFSGSECITDVTSFLAFNTSDGLMSDVALRSCVANTLDRQMLIENCGIFASTDGNSGTQGDKSLSELLADQDYDRTDEEGFVYKRVSGKNVYAQVHITQVVESSGSIGLGRSVAKWFEGFGVKATVSEYESLSQMMADSKRVAADIIITEIDLPPNGDISSLIDPVNGIFAELGQDTALWDEYVKYRDEVTAYDEFEGYVEANCPYTVLYRKKVQNKYNRSFAEGVEICPEMPYYGIENWYIYEQRG